MAEPICCDEPMVHNSWTGEYECADAYFTLIDDGVLGDFGLKVDESELTEHQAERHQHWLTLRRPDGELAATASGSNVIKDGADRA